MPTYKFEISELVHRYNSGLEIEAESLKDAIAQLVGQVPSPDFYWSADQRSMMVLELSVVDDQLDTDVVLLEDTRTKENGTQNQIWPMHMVKDGRAWEGEEGGGYDAVEYLMENIPSCLQDLIDKEEQAE